MQDQTFSRNTLSRQTIRAGGLRSTAALLLAGGAALAFTVGSGATASASMTTMGASGDTFVKGEGTTRDGTGGKLDVRGETVEAPAFSHKSYVKFDLSGSNADGSAPATFDVTLYDVHPRSNGTPESSYIDTLNLYGLDAGYTPSGDETGSDWDEGALTWDNAPANDTSSLSGFHFS